jgi:hypothetical protein
MVWGRVPSHTQPIFYSCLGELSTGKSRILQINVRDSPKFRKKKILTNGAKMLFNLGFGKRHTDFSDSATARCSAGNNSIR